MVSVASLLTGPGADAIAIVIWGDTGLQTLFRHVRIVCAYYPAVGKTSESV